MELFIAMMYEIIEGEGVGETILGVYDTHEAAEDRCAEVESFTEYDPVLRTVFGVTPAELNEPIEFDDN